MSIKVAVYGSLKQGFGNNRLLKDSELLGTDTINGWKMYHLGGFPGIVDGKGDISIEVYEVDEPTFERLDALEGYPSFYDRKKVGTEHGEAWVYHLSDPERYSNHKVVESGVW